MKKRGRPAGSIKQPVQEVVDWYMSGWNMADLARHRGVSRQYYDNLVRRYIADGRMPANARAVHLQRAMQIGFQSDDRRMP